jgi:hypothetical protein
MVRASSVVRTRLPCTDHNRSATSWASREATRANPRCEQKAILCRAGKTATFVTCPDRGTVEDFKDSFFRKLDRLRREGRVTMSGKIRRR